MDTGVCNSSKSIAHVLKMEFSNFFSVYLA